MTDLKTEIGGLISGEVVDDDDTLAIYSHDASLFELKPKLVAYPKNSSDVEKIVKYVTDNKSKNPELYITPRSAGTDMSGGAIGESITVDLTKHINDLISVNSEEAHVQPGLHYRDFEPKTLAHNALMPSFPASRELCTVGGMVSNNAGGEMSLQYGKTINFVKELKVVLNDGNEYTVKPLNKNELDQKMAQKDFEGQIYRQVFSLVDKHYEKIKEAKPNVSKNSTGYNLWDIWDRETGVSTKNIEKLAKLVGKLPDQSIDDLTVPFTSLGTTIKSSFNHALDKGSNKAISSWKQRWVQSINGQYLADKEIRRNHLAILS